MKTKDKEGQIWSVWDRISFALYYICLILMFFILGMVFCFGVKKSAAERTDDAKPMFAQHTEDEAGNGENKRPD